MNKKILERLISAGRHPMLVEKAPLQVGDLTDDGIYFARWKLEKLGKTFNLFAMPQDLPKKMKLADAADAVAALKDADGFDGALYPHESGIYMSLESGRYKGQWFIPPAGMLCGAEDSPFDSLLRNHDKGALEGTLRVGEEYGSSTWTVDDYNDITIGSAMLYRENDGSLEIDGKRYVVDHDEKLRFRPVRMVQVKP